MKSQNPTDVNKIIVHHTASNMGTEKMIHEWHTDPNNPAGQFDETGYHFIILNGNIGKGITLPSLDGMICPGRPLKYVGAHCKGRNTNSIGICLVGTATFTDAQFKALAVLIKDLEVMYGRELPGYAHKFFDNSKKCPKFNMCEWGSKYRYNPQAEPIEQPPAEQPTGSIEFPDKVYILRTDDGSELAALGYPSAMDGITSIAAFDVIKPTSRSSD